MSARRILLLVSHLAICLLLVLGGQTLVPLSQADEPQGVPSQTPEKPADSNGRDAAEDAAKDASSQEARKRTAEELGLLELFADTLDQVERNYVKDVTRRQLMEAAIRGMLSELDPYSNFIPPKQLDRFKVEVENEFGGVGIQVSSEKGQLRVISPLVGTPAYRAGVMSGDSIIEIDGQSTKGITLDEAVQRMKGLLGTKVTLKLLRAGATEVETVELERENIRVETILGESRNPDDSWRWLLDPEKNIACIRITGFGRHTAEDLRKVLQQLANGKLGGLILDLRFNPGGLLSSAIEVSDMFISQGRIVSTEGRNVESRAWDATQKGTFEGFPMTVLVNRYSASASEIVAACLQDHNRAVVIGERTWGKGSVQNVIELERGASALKLTTAGYHRPNGKNIHRFPDAQDSDDWGVVPNSGFELQVGGAELTQLIALRREKDIVRKQNGEPDPSTGESDGIVLDPQLQKALEYLREKLEVQQPAEEPAAEHEPKAEEKAEAKPTAEPNDKPPTEAGKP
jgi:carboxyl-terminal processing protease